MKKELFNLQLFAEETGSGSTGADDTGNTGGADNTGADQGAGNQQPGKEEQKKDEPKYTDADLDRIINKKFAEFQAKKDKEVAEAQKLAEMNAQEKAEYNLNQEKEAHAATQKELDEYKRKDTLAEMSRTARKMLSDEGINISDDLLSLIVTTDAEQTKTAVTGFTKLFKAAVDDAVKEKAKGTTPKIITNNSEAMGEIEKRIAKYT